MPGQIMVTFDDATEDQLHAMRRMGNVDIPSVVCVPTSLVGSIGFMDWDDLRTLQEEGHAIIGHSASHWWAGIGEEKPIDKHTKNEITRDLLDGQKELNDRGFDGGCVAIPFGTCNVAGGQHLQQISEYFDWVRMTIGAPLDEEHELWTIAGGKRHYPKNFTGKFIGITCAADMRHPQGVAEAVGFAAETDALAVLLFHRVSEVSGNGQNLTWSRFLDYVNQIDEAIHLNNMEVVLPRDLIGERK